MRLSQDEDLMVLQDVLDEIVSGRTEGHACPFCGAGQLSVELDEGRLRVECPACGKFFEGYL